MIRPAQNNGGTVGRGNRRADIPRRNIRDIIVIDLGGTSHVVHLLQNIERDLFLGVDERHDFELKRHFLKFDIGLLRQPAC